jgi:hypothetical protein
MSMATLYQHVGSAAIDTGRSPLAPLDHLPPIHDHELLPDLADQSCGEIFKIINCVENHRIGKPFGVQRGHLANKRQQLAGIVQVAAKFHFTEGPLG